jgi:hypothetical protein
MLILACSRRKRSDEELLPAVERYDGPAFRVLRRFVRERSSEAPEILILSAEHGLIPHDLPIPNYNRTMTRARALQLRPHVVQRLGHVLGVRHYQRVLVLAGRTYLEALGTPDYLFADEMEVRIGAGSLGRRLADLHDWLYGMPPALRYNSHVPVGRGRAQIRGIEVSLTPEKTLEVARQALLEEWGNPDRYESWYVNVDGQRVAPKWLVSRLTGLPVRAFTTEQARRALCQLGVEVRRA